MRWSSPGKRSWQGQKWDLKLKLMEKESLSVVPGVRDDVGKGGGVTRVAVYILSAVEVTPMDTG